MIVPRRAALATKGSAALLGEFRLALLGVALLVPSLAHASGYNFTDVINPGDPAFNQELGINNSGVIGGYFGDGTVVFNNGYTVVLPSSFTAENFPGAVQTQVVAINSAGDTAGFYIDNMGTNHGFVKVGGTFYTIDDPAGVFNQLLGLNDSLTAAGYYQNAMNTQFPFTATSLTSSPTFTPVPDLPMNTGAQATGVNNAGLIVGFYVDSMSGNTYGYIVNPMTNAFTQLAFPGSTFTQALGENNNGTVVGDYMDAGGNTHGFAYSGGSFMTVDDPLGSGTMTVINGVNDQGQLVGFYMDAHNNTIGLEANPTPEPGSFVFTGLSGLLIGLGWLGTRKRSSRR